MAQLKIENLREWAGELSSILGKMGASLNRTYPHAPCKGSQHQEDEILKDLLPGNGGTYVDIGAGEPLQCSNTWAFYQRGWRGLLVEPLFYFWAGLLHQRPGDLLYDAAVRSYTGFTLLRIQGTVSSVVRTWDIAEQCELVVPCEPPMDLLAKFPAIRDSCRFCSIDTEGAEGEVLQSIDWETFRPEVFCVEYREYDPEATGADISGPWRPILEEHGYTEVARTPLNLIFQRGDKVIQ